VRRDALLAAVFAGVFVGITVALAAGEAPGDLDLAILEWAEAHRSSAAEAVGRVLNRLGQGGPLLGICVVLALWLGLLRWRRAEGWWRALQPPLYVLTAAGLVVPTVLAVKWLTERGAPSSPLPPEQTVRLMGPLPPGAYDTGYPGGHAVNTIVWYGVLLLLATALLHAYRRPGPPPWLRVAFRVAPPVVVTAVTVYLSFHWLTDSLAGLALGLAVDRVLCLLRRLAPGASSPAGCPHVRCFPRSGRTAR
jgi:membrane-associated phospholipid phosphatase